MNKLAFETSPYLLQHKDNPVDWFPWSNEAFEEAKSRDVPIFLSIGYSTCHWCHVMEKECFEDKEVAELMNQNFVNIKVDREERPDIDGIYMNIVQMMTGSGGWPMTVLLNHEQKPFFSGTFFPKQSKYGRIGMVDLIPKIREAWLESRNEVNESADKITSSLNSTLKSNEEEKSQLDSSIFDRIFNNFTKTFDHQYGGFGGKPKFPTPHNLLFLLNYYKLTKNNSALEMVETTLLKMRYGGIFDQIGFGFHRYATDNTWTVPHFEKMLYDNALLLMVYGEAFRITKNEFFKNVCNEIFEYIKRVMISPDGLFYSAEDADSEGEEGKYYIWKISELKEILGNDFCEFAEIYSIKAEGNFLDESTRELNSQNILFVNEKFHKSNSTNLISIENRLKLLGIREKRIKPLKDTKILTDWNGLMIYSLVTTSQNINNSEMLEIAEKSAQVILKKNFKKGYLVHIDKGENSIQGFIDDYAYLGLALNSLYLATMKEDI